MAAALRRAPLYRHQLDEYEITTATKNGKRKALADLRLFNPPLYDGKALLPYKANDLNLWPNRRLLLVLSRTSRPIFALVIIGITGSGKTEVYLSVLETILAQGKQALILVPEIGLTPQTIRRFKARFNAPSMFFTPDSTMRTPWYGYERNGEIMPLLSVRARHCSPFQQLGDYY